MTKIKDTGKRVEKLDPEEVAKALGAEVVGKVSGPAEGLALYRERKHCPIMCRLLDDAHAELDKVSATYEKSHREWTTKLEALQEENAEQKRVISEYRQEVARLRGQDGK